MAAQVLTACLLAFDMTTVGSECVFFKCLLFQAQMVRKVKQWQWFMYVLS